MRNEPTWILLKMIGGQPVILWANKSLKKVPGATGQGAQFLAVIGGKRSVLVYEWPVDPGRNPKRRQPREQQGGGRGKCGRSQHEDQHDEQQCKNRYTTHLFPDYGQSLLLTKKADRMRGRRPLQQSLSGDGHAHQGSRDGIQHQQGLIESKRKPQQPTSGPCSERRCIPAQRDSPRALDQSGNDASDQGSGRRCQSPQRPHQRRAGQPQPARDQQRQQRRRRDTAAQVLQYLPSIQQREVVAAPPPVRTRRFGQHPGRQLPVSTHPAM